MYLKRKAINYEREVYIGEKGFGGSPSRPPQKRAFLRPSQLI
jgi:hypothetical protein